MRTFGTASLLLVLAACGTNTVGPSSSNPSQANPPDTSSPTVSITSPTASGAYSTASAAVALAGIATDNVGVASVSWRNAANGTSGGATGTSSWTIPSVALVSGVNTITVSARDAAGNTGGSTLAVTYNPGGTVSLSGNVDSSLVNLNRSGANTVYLYNGTVTPSGVVQPAATTLVTQDNGACTFSYRFGTLPAGSYTVALSSDGATFVGTSTVTLPGTHDFPANRRLQVGSTRTLRVPSAAAAVALNGDLIEIDAGDYPDDNVVWTQNNLTLRGVGGGRAHMRSTTLIGNGKGIWVTDGQNTTVENIEFSGASVTDQNGAGIRTEGPNLAVCNGYFHDNENGILGGGGVVLIEYSEFDHNGFGDGFTHNMYISDTSLFTLQYSYSHRAHVGHNVKSRSQETRILYNRIMDEADGDGSYAIDIPQVGRTFIIGNLIQQGPLTDNSTIIAYGAESALNVTQELYVVNNTIVNDLHSGAFFSIRAGTTARMVNNIFSGGGSLQTGAGITYATSLVSPPLTTPPTGVTNAASAGLVNSAAYDYHLTSTSPAINAGSDPGSVGTVSLVPTSQYVDPVNRQDRPSDGSIDIGAYEFQ